MTESLTKSFEILLKNGEYAEAEKLLVPYMQDNPDDWDAKLLYGTCRMMQGDTETAKIIHQQASEYFESGKDIPEGQKSFWDKYKKLIFYGAVGAALVLSGYVVYMKCTSSISGGLKYAGPQQPPLVRVDQHHTYAGPQQPPLVRVDQHHKYAGPMRPEMELNQESAAW